MHFFYLDETGCTGSNLLDLEQPIFVLGGVSVKDEGWLTTTSRFNAALDEFFGGTRPPGAELHACDLINGQGIFAEYEREERNALAHQYLDIIAERLHSIHFIAIDKAAMAAELDGTQQAFFDLSVPYLLSFNYLVNYIERYTKQILGRSARAIIIMDPKESYQAQIDKITHYRRYDIAAVRRLKWLVEFSYPVNSVRHPMIQVSDLVIFLVRKFLEMDNGYRPDWTPAARTFFASCYDKIIDRVKWKNLILAAGREQTAANDMLAAARSVHRNCWKQFHGIDL